MIFLPSFFAHIPAFNKFMYDFNIILTKSPFRMKKPLKKQTGIMVVFSKAIKTIPGLFETKEKKEFKRWKNFLAN
ncbi:hypothetical protein HNQ91_005672 [Filimonas zeae]|uniref:Uncharacterized protein n=1 Tax=Filimonas zeae TaxID=1737353 RepID=A0A917J6J7_9BACT|nr:hypothetical protein [Filimonas zeae]GGH81913.1 hypothetical protein GCM10011379_55020 [Filimonas zeae]